MVFAAEWLAERLDCRVVMLVRHPAGIVSSLKRIGNGWADNLPDIASQPELVRRYLSSHAAALEQAAGQPLDPVGHGALLWLLIHSSIAQQIARHPEFIVVRYEDLATDPLPQFRDLYERLDLPFDDRAEKAVRAGCMAGSASRRSAWGRVGMARTAFQPMESKANAWAWRDRLSTEEIERRAPHDRPRRLAVLQRRRAVGPARARRIAASSRRRPETADQEDIAVRASGLTKRYGRTLALDRLDLAIRRGEVYGFLGPNGAGKTTTIRLVLGLQRPTAGSVSVFGIDAWRDPVRAHRRVAFVAGEPMLWPALTGLECLDFLARLHGGVDDAYRDELIERFAFDPGKRVRDYSKGNRQKIQLIAAFSVRADLLVLDEPTSGLDPLMEAAFRDTVAEARQAGQTVFLSSHILSEVEALCDRVGILRDGQAGRGGHARRAAAPVGARRRGHLRRPAADHPRGRRRHRPAAGRDRPAVRRARPGRAADRPAGRDRRRLAGQPRAVARGVVSGPLRPRADEGAAGRAAVNRAARPPGRAPPPDRGRCDLRRLCGGPGDRLPRDVSDRGRARPLRAGVLGQHRAAALLRRAP